MFETTERFTKLRWASVIFVRVQNIILNILSLFKVIKGVLM